MRFGPALLLALTVAGCGPATPDARTPPRPAGLVTDNVTRGSYVGSAACASCHPAVYEAWLRSPMRSMTRLAKDVPLEPVFDGRTFSFKDDRVTLLAAGGARYMRVDRGRSGPSLYRITKVIGGRYREDFVGAQLDGLDPGAPPAQDEERVLPVSYLLWNGALRYKGYSVLAPEPPYLGGKTIWRRTCIGCHNTPPHLSTLYDDLFEAAPKEGSAAADRRPSHFGDVGDHLLPPERRVELHITSPAGLRGAVAEEMGALGEALPDKGGLRTALAAASRANRKRFGEGHLVEVGIGCEACHGGAREHAQSPSLRPAYEPRSPLFAVTGAGGRALSRPEQVNRVCARCHTVLFSGYRPTWEGGARPHRGEDAFEPDEAAAEGPKDAGGRPPGGATINSGEARDFLLGGCATQMACTDCHDPHASDGFGDRRAGMGKVCERCHSHYTTPAQIAAHTHHRPDGPGAECLSCHMPRKNMGLDYRLTRYHRIGSPSDPARVLNDRPMECALCHDDKSAGELADTMSAWWNKTYDREALASLYGGDLGRNVLSWTLAAGKPHERAAAAGVLAEKKRRDAAALLLPVLIDERPLVRYFAREALETLVGAPFPWDVGATDPERPARAAKWLADRSAPPGGASD